MAEHKPIDLKVDDLVTLVATAAGVYVNNPEQAFVCKLGLTMAQAEICNLHSWRWLRSTGSFLYSASAATVNLYSVSSGKYKALGRIETMRLGRDTPLHEVDATEYQERIIGRSTAAYPDAYMRVGETTLRWCPLPTSQHSVYFTFTRYPGFVHGNEDVIIPRRFVLTALVPLAKRKVWELRGDVRATQADAAYSAAILSMMRDDGKPVADPDIRPWRPNRSKAVDPIWKYSGVYSTGNMP